MATPTCYENVSTGASASSKLQAPEVPRLRLADWFRQHMANGPPGRQIHKSRDPQSVAGQRPSWRLGSPAYELGVRYVLFFARLVKQIAVVRHSLVWCGRKWTTHTQ